MYENVVIKGIEIHHPESSADNDFFMNHFAEAGLDPSGLMAGMGRKKRYLDLDKKENALTMAVKACQKVLESSDIEVSDIDMIIFVSDTPEYLVPANALLIKEAIRAESAHIVYDHNANCIGMISAADHASRYLKGSSRISTALVVGSFYSSTMVDEGCVLSYPTFGDASCAVLLQKIKEPNKRGIIDTVYHTVSNHTEQMVFPANGLSTLMSDAAGVVDHKLVWKSHDVHFFLDVWERLIHKLTDENETSLAAIQRYCFSQISVGNIKDMVDRLQINSDAAPFFGDKYGYTGCASPFIAYFDSLKDKRAPKGKTIFCSVGAGYSFAALLYDEGSS